MLDQEREKLRAIKTFPSLVKYLRDELDWPIETDDFNEIVFDYEAEELGIDPETAVKIDEIKQLRPLVSNQPWGIFFIKFEPKRLPVVVLRRILSRLVFKKRASANKSEHASWNLDDLLFISNYGEDEQRQITFAHFSQDKAMGDLPTLKVLGWDDADTALHLDYCHQELKGKLCWPDDEHNLEEWCEKWSSAFVLRHREVITTSKDLAMRLADLARRIRSRANSVLAIETAQGQLCKLYKAFQEALIHDLGEDDFADMYAQTITYGLLAARVSRPMGVTADTIADMIPITNPFLKEMLGTFLTAGGRKGAIDFDELGVQEVVELLNSPDTHMDAILRDFGNRTQQEDPVIHFYELFLSEYDKKKKVQRGIFYTPQPVVSYIVRSVHELLQNEFGLEAGLADITTWGEMVKRKPDIKIPEGVSPDEPFVQILDPATGTATFLVEVIDIIHKTMRAKWIKQGHMALETQSLWNKYVPKHLLPRLYGFELMMAPYAIAHMKLGLKLYETGYTFNTEERVHVYLTNSLEPAIESIPQRVFEQWAPTFAHEAKAVNLVKLNKRFTIIIGNPPYSKMSANLSSDAVRYVEPFRFIGSELIVEKGALAHELNLQDDYVKFYGLMLNIINRTGVGIGSYISNFSYLDSRSLRGMRASILARSCRLNLVNLGGHVATRNTIKRDDDNVFDISQGVAIGIIVSLVQQADVDVHYWRIFGTRNEKYKQLLNNTILSAPSEQIHPNTPFFLFRPADDQAASEFLSWKTLTEIFPKNSCCVITSRDSLTIDLDLDNLLDKVKRFSLSPIDDKSLQEELGFSVKKKWNVEKCKAMLRASDIGGHYVRPILYRPFDTRMIYYFPPLLDAPARPICELLKDQSNIVLLTPHVKTTPVFTHALVSRCAAEKKSCSHDRSTQMFPLWVTDILGTEPNVPNIATAFLNTIEAIRTPSGGVTSLDKDTLHLIYAILYSNGYRNRYGDALQNSFPRIPVPTDVELFLTLIALGADLVALHLMESPKLNTPITKWQGSMPSNEVEKVTYSDETVWIDKGQTEGFRGVSENIWDFHIGGYQVCEKWLKDRKGRVLAVEDITHYQKIVVALNETIRLMKETDEVIEEHGGWPGAFVQD